MFITNNSTIHITAPSTQVPTSEHLREGYEISSKNGRSEYHTQNFNSYNVKVKNVHTGDAMT